MSDICSQCGAKCCQYFCFENDEPETFEQFEDVRWFLCHEGVTVHIDEGDWYIAIANRCRMLDDRNRCTIYEDRPLICRSYSPENCDHTSGNYDYDEEFLTPEDLERYARKTLGDRKYERERAKAFGIDKPKRRRTPLRRGGRGKRKSPAGKR